ncbi:MAG: hypothetical protein WAW42_08555, partial [Candidatus Competibacteraceae bacterium]
LSGTLRARDNDAAHVKSSALALAALFHCAHPSRHNHFPTVSAVTPSSGPVWPYKNQKNIIYK